MVTLVKNSNAIPSPSPKLLISKMLFFLLNLYKIEVVITCLIDMLELPNFDHMTKSTI